MTCSWPRKLHNLRRLGKTQLCNTFEWGWYLICVSLWVSSWFAFFIQYVWIKLQTVFSWKCIWKHCAERLCLFRFHWVNTSVCPMSISSERVATSPRLRQVKNRVTTTRADVDGVTKFYMSLYYKYSCQNAFAVQRIFKHLWRSKRIAYWAIGQGYKLILCSSQLSTYPFAKASVGGLDRL